MKLYHISNTPKIKVLTPRKSTHGVPYVYATANLELGLLFGSTKSMGDFDGVYGVRNGKPYFLEAYPNALKRRFENETCYIYEVDPTTFKEGETEFDAELVSKENVKVLNCEKVGDLYGKLKSLIDSGSITYVPYMENDSKYVEMINAHIKDRLVRYGILDKPKSKVYKFCQKHFPAVIDELENESYEREK